MDTEQTEVYFSVDLITSGPTPGIHSLLAIGACVIGSGNRLRIYERTIKPTLAVEEESYVKFSNLSLKKAEQIGSGAAIVMSDFRNWISQNAPYASKKICVGYSMQHDWGFLDLYFAKYCSGVASFGAGPFGLSGIDLRSFYVGATGAPFAEATKQKMKKYYGIKSDPTYNPAEQAVENAELFYRIQNSKPAMKEAA